MAGERSPELSSLQARRRFMITDILNSSLDHTEHRAGGLDMRLLFPRLPLDLHHAKDEPQSDTDNEEEQDNGEDEKGKQTPPQSLHF